jgi:hypothetical protein
VSFSLPVVLSLSTSGKSAFPSQLFWK